MFCVSCGHALKPDDRFCEQCGTAAAPEGSESSGWKDPVLASVADLPGPSNGLAVSPAPVSRAPAPGSSTLAPPPPLPVSPPPAQAGLPPSAPPPLPVSPPPAQAGLPPSAPPPPPLPVSPPPAQAGLPPRVSPQPPQAGRTSPPAARPASPSPVLTALVAGLVVLAVLMGGGYLAYRFLPPLLASWRSSAPSTPTPTATLTPTPTATPTTTPQPPPEQQSTVPPLEAFAGEWTNPETPGHRLRLTFEHGSLVAQIPEENAVVRLSRLDPQDSVLHGSYSPADQDSVLMTAELSSDRTRLTITLSPPQSEFERSVLVRPESLPDTPGIEEIDRSDPESYLPLLHQRFTYEVSYPDGDSGPLEVVTGNLDGQIPRSELETATSRMYPDSGPRVEVYHYLRDETGVRRVLDSDPQTDEIWLPARVVSGTSWKTESWFCKILLMQAPVDLGFVQLKCLKVQRDNPAVGVSEIAYFAPGYGEVLVKLDGMEARKLLRVESLDPREADDRVREHSPRLEEVKRRHPR